MKHIWTVSILALFTIACVLICVYLFVRPAFIEGFDLSESGQIGDTIGGISAPIVGILGAALIYLSFHVQYQANKQQREALKEESIRFNNSRDIDLMIRIFEQVNNSYQNLKYRDKEGQDAVYHFSNLISGAMSPDHPHAKAFAFSLNYILIQCIELLKISNRDHFNYAEVEIIQSTIRHFYRMKFQPYKDDIIKGLGKKDDCSNNLQILSNVNSGRAKF